MKNLIFILLITLSIKSFSQNELFKQSTLEVSKKYYSNNQKYFLVFQEDGNLVLYKVKNNETVYKWATMTIGEKKGTKCIFQDDGNLVVYNSNNFPVWASYTENKNADKVAVQDDGNLVIYSSNNQALWHTNTYEKVEIIGSGDTKGVDTKGYIANAWCGKSPESWVRGNITFDKSSGTLTMQIGLETDDLSGGPKGRLTAIFKDENGKKIAEAKSDDVFTGGKTPGKYALRNYTSIKQIDQNISEKVASILLIAECTGSYMRVFNVSEENAKKIFDIVVKML